MSITKKNDLPAMPFYVGDWLKCPEVRALQPDHRGLWFDLICYMWESTERGVMVKPNGTPYTDNEIIRMVGLDNQNSIIWLTTLLNNGVCSRREDGAIYSRKMVRDEEIRVKRRNSGSKGGNPALLVNHKDNHMDNEEVIHFIENENENINEDIDIDKGVQGKKKKTPVSETFAPTPEMIEWAKSKGVFDTNLSTEHFIDHHKARGTIFKDWAAAWRTWIRNEIKFKNNKPNGGSDGSKPSGSKTIDRWGGFDKKDYGAGW